MSPRGPRRSVVLGTACALWAGITAAVDATGVTGVIEASPPTAATREGTRGRDPQEGSVDAARAPVPVMLVPGWFDSGRDLAALRIHLLGAGWPASHVATLTFREPTGSNRDHAEELASALEDLRSASGADSVDIVAHSMGGLAVRWYLLTHPGAPVRRAVFIASPHRGTLSAHLAWGGGRDEMIPASPFLDTLNTRAPIPAGVDVITVRTLIDTHIIPGESATLPGVPDYALCCSTHAGLLQDRDVLDIVRSFLELGVVPREPTR